MARVSILGVAAITATVSATSDSCKFDVSDLTYLTKPLSSAELTAVHSLSMNVCSASSDLGMTSQQKCSSCVHVMEYAILKAATNAGVNDDDCACDAVPPRFEPYYPADPTFRDSVWSDTDEYKSKCRLMRTELSRNGYLAQAGKTARAVHETDAVALMYSTLKTQYPEAASSFCLAPHPIGMEVTYPALMACMRANCCDETGDHVRALHMASKCSVDSFNLDVKPSVSHPALEAIAELENARDALNASEASSQEGDATLASKRSELASRLTSALETLKSARLVDPSSVTDWVVDQALAFAGDVGAAKVGGYSSADVTRLGTGGFGLSVQNNIFGMDEKARNVGGGEKIASAEKDKAGKNGASSPHRFALYGKDYSHRVYYAYVDPNAPEDTTHAYVPAEIPRYAVADTALLQWSTSHLARYAAHLEKQKVALLKKEGTIPLNPWPSVRPKGDFSRQIVMRTGQMLERDRASPKSVLEEIRLRYELGGLKRSRATTVSKAIDLLSEKDASAAASLRVKHEEGSLTADDFKSIGLAPEAFMYRLETVDGAFEDHKGGFVQPFYPLTRLMAEAPISWADPYASSEKAEIQIKKAEELKKSHYVSKAGETIIHEVPRLPITSPEKVRVAPDAATASKILSLVKAKIISKASALSAFISEASEEHAAKAAELASDYELTNLIKPDGSTLHLGFEQAESAKNEDGNGNAAFDVLSPEAHPVSDEEKEELKKEEKEKEERADRAAAEATKHTKPTDAGSAESSATPIPAITREQITSLVMTEDRVVGSISEAIGLFWKSAVSEYEDVLSHTDEKEVRAMLARGETHRKESTQAAMKAALAAAKNHNGSTAGTFNLNREIMRSFKKDLKTRLLSPSKVNPYTTKATIASGSPKITALLESYPGAAQTKTVQALKAGKAEVSLFPFHPSVTDIVASLRSAIESAADGINAAAAEGSTTVTSSSKGKLKRDSEEATDAQPPASFVQTSNEPAVKKASGLYFRTIRPASSVSQSSEANDEKIKADQAALALQPNSIINAKNHFSEWHLARSDFCGLTAEIAALDQKLHLIGEQLDEKFRIEDSMCRSPPMGNICAEFCDSERPFLLAGAKPVGGQRYDWASYLAEGLYSLSVQKSKLVKGDDATVKGSKEKKLRELEREAVRLTNRLVVAWKHDVGPLFHVDDLKVASPLHRQAIQAQRLIDAQATFLKDVSSLKKLRAQVKKWNGVGGFSPLGSSMAGHKPGSSDAALCVMQCISNMDKQSSGSSGAANDDTDVARLIQSAARNRKNKDGDAYLDRFLASMGDGKMTASKISAGGDKTAAVKEALLARGSNVDVDALMNDLSKQSILKKKTVAKLMDKYVERTSIVDRALLSNLGPADLKQAGLFMQTAQFADEDESEQEDMMMMDALENYSPSAEFAELESSIVSRNKPRFSSSWSASTSFLESDDQEGPHGYLLAGRHHPSLLEDEFELNAPASHQPRKHSRQIVSRSGSSAMAFFEAEAQKYDLESKAGAMTAVDSADMAAQGGRGVSGLNASRLPPHLARSVQAAVGGVGSLLASHDVERALKALKNGGSEGLFATSQNAMNQKELSLIASISQIHEENRDAMASAFVSHCSSYAGGKAAQARGFLGRITRFFKRLHSSLFTSLDSRTSRCRQILTSWQLKSSAICFARVEVRRNADSSSLLASKTLAGLAIQRTALTSRAITLLDAARVVESAVVLEASLGLLGNGAKSFNQGLFESLVADAQLVEGLSSKSQKRPIECDGAHLRLASVLTDEELDPRSMPQRVTDLLSASELEALLGSRGFGADEGGLDKVPSLDRLPDQL